MLWKRRSQRFKGYFNEVNILSLIIAKCFVWCPIITIFSGGATGASCGLSGVSSDEGTMVILWIEFPFVVNFDFFMTRARIKPCSYHWRVRAWCQTHCSRTRSLVGSCWIRAINNDGGVNELVFSNVDGNGNCCSFGLLGVEIIQLHVVSSLDLSTRQIIRAQSEKFKCRLLSIAYP
jgi:hypothetical protein